MDLKDALQFNSKQAVEAAKANVITTEDGQTFITDDVHHWYDDTRAESPIRTHTISSIVEYIKAGADGRMVLYLQVDSPEEVTLQGGLDDHGNRETLMIATLAQDSFSFGEFYYRESLNIMLQSMFQETPDKHAIIDFISHLKEDKDSTEVTDDGITQTATIKTGVASVGTGKVPNPVALKPFRTFTEIEQPESTFVFRMRDGMQGAIFEADGGMWKNEAIRRIKGYLDKEIGHPDGINVFILG